MAVPHPNNFTIAVGKQGPSEIIKASFPLRYGKYSEIKTPEYEFLLTLDTGPDQDNWVTIRCLVH